MSTDKMIKISLGGESVWATKLTKNTATIENIPFDPEKGVNLHDVVEFEIVDEGDYQFNKLSKVIEQKTRTEIIKYDSNRDVKKSYANLYNHFEKQKIGVEGFVEGFAGIAVPLKMPKKKLQKIVASCPTNCTTEA